jgi:Transglycosylase SLT domain
MAPHVDHITEQALKYGVPPTLALAMARHESAGVANALGDYNPETGRKEAKGLWQVTDNNLKSWGFGNEDARLDPRRSTELIMPELAKRYQAAGGDYGLMQGAYMRPGHFKRVMAGEPLEKVFGSQPIALARIKYFQKIQQTFPDWKENMKKAEEAKTPAPLMTDPSPNAPNFITAQTLPTYDDYLASVTPPDLGYTPADAAPVPQVNYDTFGGLDASQAAFLQQQALADAQRAQMQQQMLAQQAAQQEYDAPVG